MLISLAAAISSPSSPFTLLFLLLGLLPADSRRFFLVFIPTKRKVVGFEIQYNLKDRTENPQLEIGKADKQDFRVEIWAVQPPYKQLRTWNKKVIAFIIRVILYLCKAFMLWSQIWLHLFSTKDWKKIVRLMTKTDFPAQIFLLSSFFLWDMKCLSELSSHEPFKRNL